MRAADMRPTANAGASGGITDDRRLLEREVAALQRRSSEVLAAPLLAHAACNVLKAMSRDIQSRVQQVHRDLDLHAEPAAVGRIHESVAAIHLQIDRLSGQVELLETTVAQVAELDAMTQSLLAQKKFRYQRISDLADAVINQVLRNESLGRLIPVPGLLVPMLVPPQVGIDHASVFIKSLQIARQLVWMVRHEIVRDDSLQVATAATLLQDIGLLPLFLHFPAASARSIRRARWLLDQHPVAGAAILGGVTGAPVGLADIVAAHHERLDRKGYPRGLGSDSLPRLSRWVGALNRLDEISQDVPVSPEEQPSVAMRLGRAALQLQSEARQGHWDADFANLILERLQPEMQVERVSLEPVPVDRPIPSEPALPEPISAGPVPPEKTDLLELHGKQSEVPPAHRGQSAPHLPRPGMRHGHAGAGLPHLSPASTADTRFHRLVTGKGVFERSPLPM